MITQPDPEILATLRAQMRQAVDDAEMARIDYEGLQDQLNARTVDPARRTMIRRDSDEFRQAREDFAWARDRALMYANALAAESAYITAMCAVPPVGVGQ